MELTSIDMTSLDHSIAKVVGISVRAILTRWLCFFLVSSLAFAALAVGILYLQPVYEGTSILLTGQSNIEPTTNTVRPQSDNSVALVQVARSNDVIRTAIANVGSQYKPPIPSSTLSLIERLRMRLFGAVPPVVPSALETAAITDVNSRLNVRSEPNSNILQISFRDSDPALAARFANAISQAFVDRQVALTASPGAADFFRSEKKRFDEELREASAALERFSVENQIYAIDEQRELLLRRLNDMGARISATRSDISDKVGQRQMLAEALRRLKPVARSPYVSSLVDSLGGDRPSSQNRIADVVDDRTSDPPLLLIQVYQQSMVSLFKLSSEILGAQNLQQQLEQEQAKLTAQVNTLSRNAEEAARLKQNVREATYNSELYAKRAVEEQITFDLHVTGLASVKVVQTADEASRPAFPNYRMLFPAAAVFSLMLGLGAVLLLGRPRR
jgi:uncharacterized protein involved in exopolysaccharide biosynthesis